MNSVKLNMKKSILLISMFAMALGFVACSNDDDIIEQPVVTLPQDNKMTVSAIVSDEITRTALGDGNSVVWSEGDVIMIGGQTFTLQSGEGTTKGEFTGTTLADGEYDVFYGVSVSDGSKSISDVQKYNPDKKIADAPMYARVTVTNGVAGPIEFTNLCGLIKVTIKAGSEVETIKRITISSSSAMAGEFDIAGKAAVIKSSSSYDFMALNCGSGVAIGNEAKDFYIAVPENSYKHFEITLLASDDKIYTKKVNANTPIVVQRTKITNVSFTAASFEATNEFVDLGLTSGTKWATKNIGAATSTDAGKYYKWGETVEFSESNFNWAHYKWGFQYSLSKYCYTKNYGTPDYKTVLDEDDDIATKEWGSAWRMPTHAEIDELLTECTWTWVDTKGQEGYTVSKDGKSIFLPVTDYYRGNDGKKSGSAGYGYYWSRSLNTSNSSQAYYFYFNKDTKKWYTFERIYGLVVRPVLR